MKAQYYKSSAANFFNDEEKGRLYAASGVAERIPEYGNPDKSRPIEASYANHAGTGEGSLSLRLCSNNHAKQQVDLIAEKIPFIVK